MSNWSDVRTEKEELDTSLQNDGRHTYAVDIVAKRETIEEPKAWPQGADPVGTSTGEEAIYRKVVAGTSRLGDKFFNHGKWWKVVFYREHRRQDYVRILFLAVTEA